MLFQRCSCVGTDISAPACFLLISFGGQWEAGLLHWRTISGTTWLGVNIFTWPIVYGLITWLHHVTTWLLVRRVSHGTCSAESNARVEFLHETKADTENFRPPGRQIHYPYAHIRQGEDILLKFCSFTRDSILDTVEYTPRITGTNKLPQCKVSSATVYQLVHQGFLICKYPLPSHKIIWSAIPFTCNIFRTFCRYIHVYCTVLFLHSHIWPHVTVQ